MQKDKDTTKTKKEVPHVEEIFLDDNLERTYILSNGETLSERYANLWRSNGVNLNSINLKNFVR